MLFKTLLHNSIIFDFPTQIYYKHDFKLFPLTFLMLKVVFPSFGERYIPTVLFNSIYEEVQKMQQI